MKRVLILILLLSASIEDFLASACGSDRTGQWLNGRKTRDWCRWVKKGEKKYGSHEVTHRCQRKDLYEDCPVACKEAPPCGCIVPIPSWIGDGICDPHPYNSPECDYDGGDCDKWTFQPSISPSESAYPTTLPSVSPSSSPSESAYPTTLPSASPSESPSASFSPTTLPSVSPSESPSVSFSPTMPPTLFTFTSAWFSNEIAEGYSEVGAVVAIQCKGWYCDDKRLKYHDAGLVLDTSDSAAPYWTKWFSQEAHMEEEACGTGYLVAQIQCQSTYCDNLRLFCAKPASNYIITNERQDTEYFSQSKPDFMYCPDGYYLYGINCKNYYCGAISLRCAQVNGP